MSENKIMSKNTHRRIVNLLVFLTTSYCGLLLQGCRTNKLTEIMHEFDDGSEAVKDGKTSSEQDCSKQYLTF